MGFLSKLINLGGFLNGSKTILGIISVAYFLIATYKPEYKALADTIIEILGLSLLPIGVADRVLKARAAR